MKLKTIYLFVFTPVIRIALAAIFSKSFGQAVLTKNTAALIQSVVAKNTTTLIATSSVVSKDVISYKNLINLLLAF